MLKHIALLGVVTLLLVSSILFMVDRSRSNDRRINFELSDTRGAIATHKQLWGKWSIVTFGFTNCPDVCPTHAAQIGAALFELSKDSKPQAGLEQAQAVFISVDYLRDKAEELDRYLKYFHPDYIGYLGSPEQLDQVTDSFKVAYSVTQDENGDIDVLHSSLIYITDPYGRIAKQLPFGSSAKMIVSEVRSLM